MNIIQAIILGIVQGITELLPISSSAHLTLIPWILGWMNNASFMEDFEGSFDVALHVGTLLAIGLFFIKDWINLIKAGFKKVFKKEDTFEGKMFWYIVLATIPAGIIGIVLEKLLDNLIGDNLKIRILLLAIALILMGIILYIVDKKSKSEVKYEEITFKQAMLVGISQALAAVLPGVSRSGITITTARALKIDRESASKYSFLLSVPIVAGAALIKIMDFDFSSIAFWLGVLTSFITGLIVIKFFMQYIKKGSFKGFAIYRVVLGIVLCILLIVK